MKKKTKTHNQKNPTNKQKKKPNQNPKTTKPQNQKHLQFAAARKSVGIWFPKFMIPEFLLLF